MAMQMMEELTLGRAFMEFHVYQGRLPGPVSDDGVYCRVEVPTPAP